MNDADSFYLWFYFKQAILSIGVGVVIIYVAIETGKWINNQYHKFRKKRNDKQ